MVLDYSKQQMVAGTTIFTPGWFQTGKNRKKIYPKWRLKHTKLEIFH